MKRPSKKSKPGGTTAQGPARGSSGGRGVDQPLSSGRRWLFRLFALLVVPLLVLFALEGGLRLVGYGYDPALLKKITIGGKQFYVNNESFSLRFFPSQLTRGTGPIRMPVQKPAGTYRIFILGESAAMGDPEPAYGPARYLEALLNARYPQTRFEIINTGITAINSHVILPIARDCARHEGDLWIVYMGNNEMVGPFGAATVFGEKAPPLAVIRLNLALQKTRLGQLLVNLGRKLKGGGADAPSWGGMEMFAGNQLAVDDPRKEVVYHNFARNLQDILKAGLGSGVKILLNTVAVNLKDSSPFASITNSNLPPAERAQFERDFTNGLAAAAAGNFSAAAQNFAAAAELEPQMADVQFQWGRSLLTLTDTAAAREHLQLACDDDALPFRTDSRLNALIAATSRKMAGARLVFFDAPAALAADTPSGILGDETFYEHVHFNFEGAYRLGLAWAEQVAEMLPPSIARAAVTNGWASPAACALRLGLSDWNRELIYQHMIGRLQQLPLSGQWNNAERVSQLEARVRELKPRLTAANAARAEANFQSVLQVAPDDYLLRENHALFLQAEGNLPQAAAEWRRLHELLPSDYLACFQLGRMLELQGQWSEAEPNLRRAVEIHPTLTEGWIELGIVLAAQGKYDEALASFVIAWKQRPQDAQIAVRRGKVLVKMNRHDEAMEAYRAAIRLNPSDWEAHYELGGELDAAGRLAESGKEFGEAARLNPGNSRTHFNYGVLLAKQGRLDDAQREFEESLRLEPAYTKAQEYLDQVRALTGRPR